ncbi:hypothetical protein DVH24_024275 [Malus domestica]|uniref:Uncharacterized protein n=1 Tax=Malus domestica TaxID=3750 RepID=A0A498JMP3_MALDO|nr:hypothetical protein DVH24_024275 [Malus domestica]
MTSDSTVATSACLSLSTMQIPQASQKGIGKSLPTHVRVGWKNRKPKKIKLNTESKLKKPEQKKKTEPKVIGSVIQKLNQTEPNRIKYN